MLSSRLSTEGRGADTHFIVYSFIPDVLAQNPLFGLGLNTFSVYYEFQTGKTNFGPHSFYVASFVEYGLVGTLLFAAFLVYLFRRAALTRRIGRALAAAGDPLAARIRPLGWGLTAAHRLDDGLEHLLPDDVLLLLLRARAARDRGAGRARAPPRNAPVKVVVLTTSYPRDADDVAGTFVRDGVEALRADGVEVARRLARRLPALRDRLRRRDRQQPPRGAVEAPRAAALPRSRSRARRGGPSRDADVVHAHWLPSALPALATGKPFVLQLWGSDVALARRVRPLARSARPPRARSSSAPRRRSPRTRARSVRATSASIPSGVAIPETVGEPDEPPHVLYVGRLSEEKGVRELAEAARGLPLVVVGDGPLRSLFPQAIGLRAARASSAAYYERAAVVVVPSRREGYGVVAREAMAYGRPVVATAVGGLVDAVEDGVTGVLVPPGDATRCGRALERLLGDPRAAPTSRANARERARRALLARSRLRRRRAEVYDEVVARSGRDPALGCRARWARTTTPGFPTLAELLADAASDRESPSSRLVALARPGRPACARPTCSLVVVSR